jgi:hypothetical protein
MVFSAGHPAQIQLILAKNPHCGFLALKLRFLVQKKILKTTCSIEVIAV